MRIAVIDYDVGNVRSILSAFDNQGVHALLTNDKKKILESDGVILPGVGAFKHGMDNLNKYGLVGTIKEYIETGKPFMGICLGMQMLFEESEEFGNTMGLGLISGKVIKAFVRFSQDGPHPSDQELVLFLRQFLEPYKIPRLYEWVDDIPRTQTGKIQRSLL